MVLIRILAVVDLLAGVAGSVEGSLGGGSARAGLRGQDLFGKDFGGQGREGSDATFEVVATAPG